MLVNINISSFFSECIDHYVLHKLYLRESVCGVLPFIKTLEGFDERVMDLVCRVIIHDIELRIDNHFVDSGIVRGFDITVTIQYIKDTDVMNVYFDALNNVNLIMPDSNIVNNDRLN
jgi:hypothetical protein